MVHNYLIKNSIFYRHVIDYHEKMILIDWIIWGPLYVELIFYVIKLTYYLIQRENYSTIDQPLCLY